jgi:indolepyruvate ferredoxin oxidoreductase
MDLISVSLDDKYRLERGRIFINGTQALVRLAIEQQRRDAMAGLKTAGYVTGYRGSPLGGVDKEFKGARAILEEHHVKFHPAVNEDLAATALWGTQQVGLHPGAKYDGVFGIWYGKGPGVDRSGDVFRHANLAGTSKTGGVLALFGDDPACKSSTVPSQSEHAIIDAQIPLLNPVDVAEVIEYGLLGFAMSRYSGCWTGLKCITDNVDSSASVLVDPAALRIVMPDDFEMPPGGLSIRWPDPPVEQELRLHRYKIYAARAFARANGLNRVTMTSSKPRFGIVATGKAYLDTLQALDDLGIDEAVAERIGLTVLKIGMPWPLEPTVVRQFAMNLEEVLVIEEKRAVIENQIKEQLYNWDEAKRPRIVGKFDENREWILPSAGELTPARIARVIAKRLAPFYTSEAVERRLEFLDAKEAEIKAHKTNIQRLPYFCSGCPHNTSTKIPEGSRAAAGIGCHYMVLWMDRATETFTHMGGEGANWIGQAPFTETPHIFTNIGDGTYYHSGILAIRAAIAAKVNITYKILYNDAVAMTGGQPMDGPLDVPMISRQIHAEGVKRIAIVSDEPDKYHIGLHWAPGVTFHDRHEMDALQRQLRQLPGVTAIIYDQTCAAEKRRRRKRGTYPDPAKRAFINEFVCEGCGDCGVQSNCVSVVPKETPLGRKRAIDQSNCNKDFTCVDGFCPSFVTVEGAAPKKPKPEPARAVATETPWPVLPTPEPAKSLRPYSIVVGGIGGTGVVTVSALIAMAAHVEKKGVTVLDVAGLAQKNGAVYAHIRICDDASKLYAVRIASGGADLLMGCDMVTAGGDETISKLQAGRSKAIINAHETMTADFTRAPDLEFPDAQLRDAIDTATGGQAEYVEATELARRLMGDTIAANLFLIGYAFQKGLLPLSEPAIVRAIELNRVAVEANIRAFTWGRRAAHDCAAVEKAAGMDVPAVAAAAEPQSDFVAERMADLAQYQDQRLAERYREMAARIAAAEAEKAPDGRGELTDAVERAYFKLLAYKDEYEVARLYTDGRFERALAEAFEPGAKLKFHLAPPWLASEDPLTGKPQKKTYGPWVFQAMKLLASMKGLRGGPLDLFGKTAERRAERRDIADYEALVAALVDGLTPENHATAVELARLPLKLRGYGHVKDKARRDMHARQADLMRDFMGGGDTTRIAAE